MPDFDSSLLSKLYIPPASSHKGQNGKLLIIGGSQLFHAASLWALEVASKILDMVFYASVPENNAIVQNAKEEFRNGIVIPRDKIDSYVEEADCILIGPGLPRVDGMQEGDDDTKILTERLLKAFPHKKWVIDGGSLQVITPDLLPKGAIVTPHDKEFRMLFDTEPTTESISEIAKKYSIIILMKGVEDVVCSPSGCINVAGGNAGMTKGGTGDVLAGLVGALYCKNEAFLAATCASYINKKAGESLFEKVGYYFNASDLADEIPVVLKKSLIA
jgi:hydroxyethylthiazole kinase-like uncharacterized protein yjeF